MPSSRRILDPDLELAQPLRIPLQDPRQPQLLEFLFEPGGQAGVHAAAAGEDDGAIEGGADVQIGGLDGVEEELGDAGLFDVDQVRLEQALGRLEALAADADDAAIGQRVGLHQHRRVFAEALVEVQVVRDVAQLLLDLAHSLEVRRAVQRVAAAQQEGDQVARDVAAGHVEAAGQVVEDGGLVDGDDVGDAIAGVDDNAGGEALRVQGQHGLDGHVDTAEVVGFEHDFAHLFAVFQRVHGGFGQEDLAAGWVDLEFFVEGEVPEVHHVVPAFDDAVLHLCGWLG